MTRASIAKWSLTAVAVFVVFVGLLKNIFSSRSLRTVTVGNRITPNEHGPCDTLREPSVFRAMTNKKTSFASNCDLSQGLAFGNRCDLRRGYTFFTFDPEQDEHVSHGMIETGGLYDAHVHVALDHALHILKRYSLSCDLRDSVVLDVGSNLGTLALYASALGCRTHAFEIQPAVICRLEMSMLASNLDIQLHRKAVHSESGKIFSFGSSPTNPGGVGITKAVSAGEEPTEVESVRLDDMFFEAQSQILFMKVDTEGNEFEVLKSAEKLLAEKRIKYMVIEVRPSQTEMVNFLYSHGYWCTLIRAARSRSDVACRKTEASQVISELEAIEYFSDLFCCFD